MSKIQKRHHTEGARQVPQEKTLPVPWNRNFAQFFSQILRLRMGCSNMLQESLKSKKNTSATTQNTLESKKNGSRYLGNPPILHIYIHILSYTVYPLVILYIHHHSSTFYIFLNLPLSYLPRIFDQKQWICQQSTETIRHGIFTLVGCLW